MSRWTASRPPTVELTNPPSTTNTNARFHASVRVLRHRLDPNLVPARAAFRISNRYHKVIVFDGGLDRGALLVFAESFFGDEERLGHEFWERSTSDRAKKVIAI